MRYLAVDEVNIVAGGVSESNTKKINESWGTIDYLSEHSEQVFYYALAAAFTICSIIMFYNIQQSNEYMKEIIKIKENCSPNKFC